MQNVGVTEEDATDKVDADDLLYWSLKTAVQIILIIIIIIRGKGLC